MSKTLKAVLSDAWPSTFQFSDSKAAILAIDLGGTKIGYGVFEVSGTAKNRSIGETPLYTNSYPTPRGKAAIREAIGNAATDALKFCQKNEYRLLPHISMGSPGRFIGKNGQIIAPGSSTNLGLTPDEFDNLDVFEFYGNVFPEYVKLTIKNDAIAQLSAGLSLLQHNPKIASKLVGQKIGYIGPGTGLGGGFCKIDAAGSAHYYSDGHIYDILVQNENGKEFGAEDLFSGTAFFKRCGLSAREVNSDDSKFAKFEPEVRLMGIFLARLIGKIVSGDIRKTRADAQWPENDIQLVAGTKIFLMGGSMGTKGKMGEMIQSTALSELKKLGILGVQLYSIPDSQFAGLLGAAHFLSPSDLNNAWMAANQPA